MIVILFLLIASIGMYTPLSDARPIKQFLRGIKQNNIEEVRAALDNGLGINAFYSMDDDLIDPEADSNKPQKLQANAELPEYLAEGIACLKELKDAFIRQYVWQKKAILYSRI